MCSNPRSKSGDLGLVCLCFFRSMVEYMCSVLIVGLALLLGLVYNGGEDGG